MKERHLHIVTHDIPWPADYGGVIDLFYKLKTLHARGVLIHLHCFTQGRKPQDELNKYCYSVTYYQRQKNIFHFSFRLPFIVKSRNSRLLINNLKKDDYPILLEGIHCSYHLFKGELADRKVFVRLHNVEFIYYRQLARNESNLLKRLYFLHESRLLRKYEAAVANKAVFIAVSEPDADIYRHLFDCQHIHYLPVFIPYALINIKKGKGSFCLYQGNLCVNENEKAVAWLLQNVFNDLDIPLVIAGKDPSKKLKDMIQKQPQSSLVPNPSETNLQELIANAHINILPSFNNTGVKLKLINAIFNGRHCIVNEEGVAGSGLEPACHLASDATSFRNTLVQLYQIEFTEKELERRNSLLQRLYDNETNAIKLLSIIDD